MKRIILDDEKEAKKIFSLVSKNPQKMDSLMKSLSKSEKEEEMEGVVFISETQDSALFKKIASLKIGKPAIFDYQNKWYIVNLQELNKSFIRPLSEVKEEIKNILLNNKKNSKWEAYLDSLKSHYKIEILIKEEKNEEKKENQGSK
jgi:hypothetical protein